MSFILFLIGMITSLTCGGNVLWSGNTDWRMEAVWTLGGTVGAVMMIVAAKG